MTSLPPILLWQEKVVCQKKTRATDGNTATLWAVPDPPGAGGSILPVTAVGPDSCSERRWPEKHKGRKQLITTPRV